MLKIIYIGMGGFIGAVLRYWISGITYDKFGISFPYGTFVVNITGAFILGLFIALTENRFILHPSLKVAITIGILGAFTTFSTFCYETVALIQTGNFVKAFLNIVLSVLIGLIAILAGIKTGNYI